jgi:hypothetical protein
MLPCSRRDSAEASGASVSTHNVEQIIVRGAARQKEAKLINGNMEVKAGAG